MFPAHDDDRGVDRREPPLGRVRQRDPRSREHTAGPHRYVVLEHDRKETVPLARRADEKAYRVTEPAAVGGVDGRADENQGAHALRPPLGQREHDLAPEGVGDEHRRAFLLGGEVGEDVRELVERESAVGALARSPAGKVRDRDARRAGELFPERFEVPARHPQAMDEDDRIAVTSCPDVEAVASRVAGACLERWHHACIPVRPRPPIRPIGGAVRSSSPTSLG